MTRLRSCGATAGRPAPDNTFEHPIVVLDLGPLDRQDAELRRHVVDRFRQGVALGVFEDSADGPDGDAELLVAVDRATGGRAGFATFCEINGGRLWIQLLWVEPERRREGIAQELLDRAIDVARARGFSAVLLGRMENNAPMLAVLESAGWKVEHVVHGIEVAS